MKSIVLILIFFHICLAHSQYIWQNLKAQYRSISTIDSLNVFIVGDDGTIIKTSDGGDSYERLESGLRCNFYSVDFYDLSNGIIGGDSSYVLTTKDGGNSWSIQVFPEEKINDVNMIDSSVAFFCTEKGNIYRANDRGKNWEKIYSLPNNPLKKIDFLDKNNGFAMHFNGVLIKTTDGGSEWKEIFNESDLSLYDFDFHDSITGAILSLSNNDRLVALTTSDGGLNWNHIKLNQYNPKWIIKFLSSRSVILFGDFGKIIRSVDLLFTFNLDTLKTTEYIDHIPPAGESFLDASTDRNGNIYTVGLYNSIALSKDSGNTFHLLNWFVDRLGSTYHNITNILYLGKNERLCMTSYSRVYRSVDAGISWKYVFPVLHNIQSLDAEDQQYWLPVAVERDANLKNGFFFNNNKGFLLGHKQSSPDDELSIFTEDGGKTWTRKDLANAQGFDRFSDGTFITSGDNAEIYRGSVDGTSWLKDQTYNDGNSVIPSLFINHDDKAFFFRWQASVITNDTLHWPSGKKIGMKVYRSTNMGKSFDSVYSEEQYGRIWYKLKNDSFGNIYLIGKGHEILKSNDDGESWASLYAPFDVIRDLLILDNNNMLAVSLNDSLAFSWDSGKTWEVKFLNFSKASQNMLTSFEKAVYFPDSSIYLIGPGRIVRGIKDQTTDLGIYRNELKFNRLLYMLIKPIPANNQISIDIWGLNKSLESTASLILYDLYGNKLEDYSSQIANNLNLDKITCPIFLDKLSLGIYLLVLRSDDNVVIRKIIKN